MDNFKIAKILAAIIFLISFAILVGWIFNIEFLKSIFFNMQSISPFVAILFMASSVIIYFLSEDGKERDSFVADVFLSSAVFAIFLLISVTIVSFFVGIDSGIDSFFVQTQFGVANAGFYDKLSAAVIINIIYIAIAGILGISDPVKFKKYLFIIGAMITLAGAVAILGYIFNTPFLYYDISLNGPMPLIAAILFILSGEAIILCKKMEYEKN